MSYIVWSKALNCRMIFDDAKTKNQARAAFRKYLKQINVSPRDMKFYMTGLQIEQYETSHPIMVRIGD